MPAGLPEVTVPDAAGWRGWLADNHNSSPGVWLVLAKKGAAAPTTLTYGAALEEAVCFGWIDGQISRRDAVSYRQRFTPRRRGSKWSQTNVALAERLITEGRMQPAGLAEVQRAQANGRWAAAYAGSAAAAVPPDLTAALAANPKAQEKFAGLTSQNRYAILYRINDAQRPETRSRRIERFVNMLARGETPYPQR